MLNTRWISFLSNACLAGNCMLLFLAFFGDKMQVPAFLQVTGRMHPLVLHFPIVLLVLAAIFTLFPVGEFMNSLHHEKPAEAKKIREFSYSIAAFSAVLVALMGFFLSKEAGYSPDALYFHKWSGIALSVLSWAWFAFNSQINAKKWLSKLVAISVLGGILVTGHQGANITHGENFLLAPLTPALPIAAAVSMENGLVYADMVQPILKEKCWQCHNDAKTKGDLNMSTEALLQKGGKDGPIWNNSAPEFGRLLQRVHLPLEAEEHMPPKGKAQLTEQEIQILYHWIKNGASFTQKIADLPETDTLRMIASSLSKTSIDEVFTFPAADENTIKKLNNDYRVVRPFAINSPALAVDFYGVSAFKLDYLKDLQEIKEQLVYLNLQKMPIKDEDLKSINNFPNLQNLNLTSTQITGKTLQDLKSLTNLKQLSLSNTAVQLADLQVLSGFSKLNNLYLWNTTLTDKDNIQLRKNLSKIHIETGYMGDTVVLKINAPLIESKETIFDNAIKVCIKNYIKGAETRYTLDGSVPDSIKSPTFKSGDSLLIDKTCTLNTKSFKAGWISSDVNSRNFFRVNIVPDSVLLTYAPHAYYPGEGNKTLVNKKIGDTEYMNSKKWFGFSDTYLETFLFFNHPQELSSVTISTLVHILGFIMPAQEVEIWGGTTRKNLVLLKKMKPLQPTEFGMPPSLIPIKIDFPKQKISVMKVVAKPVAKLPQWHTSKGQPAWFFVDEIFLN
jgi:uncharacterized membrane protein